jgi:hypothetical protein
MGFTLANQKSFPVTTCNRAEANEVETAASNIAPHRTTSVVQSPTIRATDSVLSSASERSQCSIGLSQHRNIALCTFDSDVNPEMLPLELR